MGIEEEEEPVNISYMNRPREDEPDEEEEVMNEETKQKKEISFD